MSYDALFQKIYNMSHDDIQYNYKYLGEGISRVVYAIDNNFVAKIAKGIEGRYQNNVEKYVFLNVTEYYKKYLSPIIWFRDEMLVMRRAIPLSKYTRRKNINCKKLFPNGNLDRDLKALTIEFDLLHEDLVSVSSWGLIDDVPKLIDYGCTNKFDIKYLL